MDLPLFHASKIHLLAAQIIELVELDSFAQKRACLCRRTLQSTLQQVAAGQIYQQPPLRYCTLTRKAWSSDLPVSSSRRGREKWTKSTVNSSVSVEVERL